MPKYPGSFILYEYGTVAEIAQAYKVSERTIYRWRSRARSEEGLSISSKSKYPGVKKLESFKGTRKQLAAKYGVSERTAYRWLNKATASGGAVSRQGSSKYPGASADLSGNLKNVANQYGVSTRTVSRWKQKQKEETEDQIDEFTDTVSKAIDDEDVSIDDATAEEPSEEVIQESDEFEEDLSDLQDSMSEETFQNLQGISDILTESDDLLVPGSIFNDLTKLEKLQYLDAYIQYQYDLDEHQFYNEAEHKMDFSSDHLSTVNIWGEEFEEWAQKQFDYSMYEV